MTKKGIVLHNGKVITSTRVIDHSGVVIEDGVIKEIISSIECLGGSKEYDVIDVNGSYISPGFIDIHLHGGGGADAMDGTEDALLCMSEAHAKHGTTAMVPTTLTCSDEELFDFLDIFKTSKKRTKGSKFLGIHLEGPYFSNAQKGAQDSRYIREPNESHFTKILNYSNDIIRVSAAPELNGALELSRELKNRGILASIGHSDATYEEVVKAIEAGYEHVTHLYSGMSGVKRVNCFRVAGVIESSLLFDELSVEVIADGIHLPEPFLKLIYKIKGPDKISLITDAMRAAGMPEGEYLLGSIKDGQRVVVEDGVAKLMDKTAFAGSVATADRLVRNMINLADVPLIEAVKMISLTPARIIGVDNKTGSISKDKIADITVFDSDINIKLTIVDGKIVYSK